MPDQYVDAAGDSVYCVIVLLQPDLYVDAVDDWVDGVSLFCCMPHLYVDAVDD